jgi:hypothetical protein
MKESQAADRASAMGALSKDPRNALAGAQALQQTANQQNLALLDKQQTAKTTAMQNLATEQGQVQDQSIKVAESEIAGIKSERAAGVSNIFGGIEDMASGAASIASGGMTAQEGGKIDKDGGVTPGEFDHDSNPIDMVQDGEKIGEATGGELVLPPDDVEEIRMAINDGDKNAAFNLMKNLVAKYDDNVIGDDDDNVMGDDDDDSEAQGRVDAPQTKMMNGGYLEKLKARLGAYIKPK